MTTERATPAFPSLTFLGHATVLLEIAGMRILTDPLVFERLLILRRTATRSTRPSTATSTRS